MSHAPEPACPRGEFCTERPGHDGPCWDPFTDDGPMSPELVARLAALAPKPLPEFRERVAGAEQIGLFV